MRKVIFFLAVTFFAMPAFADTAAVTPLSSLTNSVITLIGSVLGLVLTALAGMALKKLGISVTADKEALYDRAIFTAINYAEEWAHKESKVVGAKIPTGDAKLNKAIAYAAYLIDQYGLEKKAEKWIEDKLHSALGGGRGPVVAETPSS